MDVISTIRGGVDVAIVAFAVSFAGAVAIPWAGNLPQVSSTLAFKLMPRADVDKLALVGAVTDNVVTWAMRDCCNLDAAWMPPVPVDV